MSSTPVFASSARGLELPQSTGRFQWAMTASILSTDFLTLGLVFVLTVLVRQLVTPRYSFHSNLEMFPCLLLLLGAFRAKGLYPGVLLHPAEEMRRIFACISTVFLLMAATTFLWRNADAYSRSIFLVTWAVGAPLVLLSRHLIRRTLAKQAWWGVPAVVLGSGPIAQRVVRKLQGGMLGVRIAGVLSDDQVSSWPRDLPPLLGDFSLAHRLAALENAQYAIVALPQKSSLELRYFLQNCCQGFSHVLLIPDMPGLCSLGISAREIGGEVAFELPQRLFHPSTAMIKRGLDLTSGALALLVASPLFVVIAILIKLSSRGPVFFKHSRHGWNGRTFGAFKFRTMIPNADKVLADHLANHPELLFEWQRDRKLKNDPRITWIGKWLRRMSLDELPQLLNVLAGHMSLIGPRPLPLGDMEKYGAGYDLYSRVRPGITGLWQVSGRNNTTYEERIAFDEYYVRNWSIWLDSYILLKTVKAVLTAEGAY